MTGSDIISSLISILIFVSGILTAKSQANSHSIFNDNLWTNIRKSRSTMLIALYVSCLASIILTFIQWKNDNLSVSSGIIQTVMILILVFMISKMHIDGELGLKYFPHFINNNIDYYIVKELPCGFVEIVNADYRKTHIFLIKSLADMDAQEIDMQIPKFN